MTGFCVWRGPSAPRSESGALPCACMERSAMLQAPMCSAPREEVSGVLGWLHATPYMPDEHARRGLTRSIVRYVLREDVG